VTLIDIQRDVSLGGKGTPSSRKGGAPGGGPVPGTAGPPPSPATSTSVVLYAGPATPAPAGYRLVPPERCAHSLRLGPDGTVWLDGRPDDGRGARGRCPVASCDCVRTDYPGHLCLQPDGSEVWRDWP
jgi:hypothetical protein